MSREIASSSTTHLTVSLFELRIFIKLEPQVIVFDAVHNVSGRHNQLQNICPSLHFRSIERNLLFLPIAAVSIAMDNTGVRQICENTYLFAVHLYSQYA